VLQTGGYVHTEGWVSQTGGYVHTEGWVSQTGGYLQDPLIVWVLRASRHSEFDYVNSEL